VTAQPSFIHLRVHTEYSLVDGVVRVKPLMQALTADEMPAVALTDQSNLFAMVKFTRAALGCGIKPIIGVDALVRHGDDQEAPFQMVLLAQSKTGYLNLSQLISRSYLEGQHRGVPIIQTEWIEQHAEGVIALSGGRQGDIGRALLAGQNDLAVQRLQSWMSCFKDRFYIELQRTGRENEEAYIAEAVELAITHDIPVVATNDVRFLTMCVSLRAMSLMRMKPVSVFMMAGHWMTRAGRKITASSSIFAAVKRCRHCFLIFLKRWQILSRSPNAATLKFS